MFCTLLLVFVAGLTLIHGQSTVDNEFPSIACGYTGDTVSALRQLIAGQKELRAKLTKVYRKAESKGNDSDVPPEVSGIMVQQHYSTPEPFFNRSWAQFKVGFGNTSGNYWIGNERLHQLTKNGRYKLRIDMRSAFNNIWYWAEYSRFLVGNEYQNYLLDISGYSGTAGDGMVLENDYHQSLAGVGFTTYDNDNDHYHENCASDTNGRAGGFWYRRCGKVNLNFPGVDEPDPDLKKASFAWGLLPLGTRSFYYTALRYSRMMLIEL